MEKISIARRHWQKQKPAPSMSNDINEPPLKVNATEFSSCLLGSLTNEEINLLPIKEKQFVVEIVSGWKKPLQMIISIKPQTDLLNQEFFTVEKVAQTLKVSKKTIYREDRLKTVWDICWKY